MNVTSTQAYAICIQAGVPVLWWGAPGIGKTTITYAIARSLKLSIVEQVCSTWDPTDVGLPIRNGEYFERVPPKWAYDCVKLHEEGGALLYLDEYSCTPPAVQAATLKIIAERKCGDFSLPFNLPIAASANPADQAAGGWDLAPPAANRWCHLDCSISADDWCEGMIAGFPDPKVEKLPKGWESLIPSMQAVVVAYIRRFPNHRLDVPKDEESAGRAWPSPRSWVMLCRLLAAAESLGASDSIKLQLVRGTVGHPATAFMTFCENLDLPDPEILLADPTLYQHPARGDKAHAILGSVAAAVIAKNNKKRWEAGLAVMLSAARQGGTDIAVIPARSLLKNQPAGSDVPDGVTTLFPMMHAAALVGGTV